MRRFCNNLLRSKLSVCFSSKQDLVTSNNTFPLTALIRPLFHIHLLRLRQEIFYLSYSFKTNFLKCWNITCTIINPTQVWTLTYWHMRKLLILYIPVLSRVLKWRQRSESEFYKRLTYGKIQRKNSIKSTWHSTWLHILTWTLKNKRRNRKCKKNQKFLGVLSLHHSSKCSLYMPKRKTKYSILITFS